MIDRFHMWLRYQFLSRVDKFQQWLGHKINGFSIDILEASYKKFVFWFSVLVVVIIILIVI